MRQAHADQQLSDGFINLDSDGLQYNSSAEVGCNMPTIPFAAPAPVKVIRQKRPLEPRRLSGRNSLA